MTFFRVEYKVMPQVTMGIKKYLNTKLEYITIVWSSSHGLLH